MLRTVGSASRPEVGLLGSEKKSIGSASAIVSSIGLARSLTDTGIVVGKLGPTWFFLVNVFESDFDLLEIVGIRKGRLNPLEGLAKDGVGGGSSILDMMLGNRRWKSGFGRAAASILRWWDGSLAV